MNSVRFLLHLAFEFHPLSRADTCVFTRWMLVYLQKVFLRFGYPYLSKLTVCISRFTWHLNSTLSPGLTPVFFIRPGSIWGRPHVLTGNSNYNPSSSGSSHIFMFILFPSKYVWSRVNTHFMAEVAGRQVGWFQGRVGSISQTYSKYFSPEWLFSNLEKFRLCHRNVSDGGKVEQF